MAVQDRIPIVVGVTGHRAVRDKDRDALFEAVTRELTVLRARCPHSPIVMLNSLAEGADLLCADAAKALGIPLIVALPTDAASYTKDFSEEEKQRFDAHCAAAESVFVVSPIEREPTDPDMDFRYRQAGIYVAEHSHILLALWDGDGAQKDGCGTAAAVSFALEGRFSPHGRLPVRSGRNTQVIHIVCPRAEQNEPAGTVHMLGNANAVSDVLKRTDAFNASVSDVPAPAPFCDAKDPVLLRTAKLYAAADVLSLSAAKTYRRVLAWLALLGTALTVAFLLYDEAELYGLILAVGAMLALSFGLHRYAVRSDCHRRYLEYRVLAESLRVQSFLRYAGSPTEVFSLLPLTQRTETGWVLCALSALAAGAPPKETHPVRIWIEEQQVYHERAYRKTARQQKRSDRVVRIASILSVLLYLSALLFELFSGVLGFPVLLRTGDPNLYRAILKLALGSLSAATLFIANYYGKQSLSRKVSDHARMAAFYGSVLDRIHENDPDLLAVLAREELIENGHWYAYQSDNTPDVSI